MSAIPHPTSRATAFTLASALLFILLAGCQLVSGPPDPKRASRTDIPALSLAIDQFRVDTGRYPTSAEGLSALLHKPADTPAWHGPYIKKIPLDPWGRPYVYICPGIVFPDIFDLSSYGPDGLPSTPDDIGNWSEP